MATSARRVAAGQDRTRALRRDLARTQAHGQPQRCLSTLHSFIRLAQFAYQNGMAGLLVFSDPADDGFMRGQAYPNGPWRSASSIQRGQYTRSPIPVLPISWRDATPFLLGLGGARVPNGWAGAVPGVTYHIGPGDKRLLC